MHAYMYVSCQNTIVDGWMLCKLSPNKDVLGTKTRKANINNNKKSAKSQNQLAKNNKKSTAFIKIKNNLCNYYNKRWEKSINIAHSQK